MKKLIPIICVCIALIFLMSSVGGVLLPAEHDCGMREGCAICSMISVIERILHSIMLIAAFIVMCGLLPLRDGLAGRQTSPQRTASETPVQLMVKMSN